MILSAAEPSSSFNPFVVFAIIFAVIGIASFITHLVLRQKYERILLIIASICAAGVTIFLPLWAKQVFVDVPVALVISTFVLAGLGFSCLLLYPYFIQTKVVSRCLLFGFLVFIVAFIICAVFVSKHVLQPEAMNSSSALLF